MSTLCFFHSEILCHQIAAVKKVKIHYKLLKFLNFSYLRNPENIKLFLEGEVRKLMSVTEIQ